MPPDNESGELKYRQRCKSWSLGEKTEAQPQRVAEEDDCRLQPGYRVGFVAHQAAMRFRRVSVMIGVYHLEEIFVTVRC